MLFATVGQGRLFIWMMAAGAVIGLWYMLTALLRRILQAGLWLTLACDLLFGAGSAVIFLAALIAGSYGQLRFFEILAVLSGAILVPLALSPPMKALQNTLMHASDRIKSSIAKNRLIKVIFK